MEPSASGWWFDEEEADIHAMIPASTNNQIQVSMPRILIGNIYFLWYLFLVHINGSAYAWMKQ